MAPTCTLIDDGFGPDGAVPVQATTVVSGLEVPWGIAFLPNGDILVTERPGRIRLVRNGALVSQPVAVLSDSNTDEGGLLGIALHPDFETNRLFFLYRTVHASGGSPLNRVERWQLSTDGLSATQERILIEDIPASTYHNGGRLRIGPDGLLYIGTGDSEAPSQSQNLNSPAGKILRVNLDGSVPQDNPVAGNPVYIRGLRNTQGFDWPDPANASLMWVTDHGPSGEFGRSDHDEVNVARAGDNLGWPDIFGCETEDGLVSPAVSWSTATPPGGAAVYTGSDIPEWQGSLLIGTLGSRHLQRVEIDSDGKLVSNEVYFQGEFGRLRDVQMGPDGHLYVTTSNCDGRGFCPADGDRILRVERDD
ncbi:MAG: PQQ-dependent sugar dehydrogenase [Rubricoccaceae bacterium]|nr:PQQ-dependent sugar dehydrogenase [Rubricoccaceae bacterium]